MPHPDHLSTVGHGVWRRRTVLQGRMCIIGAPPRKPST